MGLVYGQAGSGKSYVIKAIRSYLKKKCRIGSTSAAAAFMVGGSTLHRLCGIPVNNPLKPMSINTENRVCR